MTALSNKACYLLSSRSVSEVNGEEIPFRFTLSGVVGKLKGIIIGLPLIYYRSIIP